MRSIWVTTSFEGFHHWADAPSEVGFLATPHRHIFHVKLEIEVRHDDRELEFIMVKWALNKFIQTFKAENLSCEMMADKILKWAQHTYKADRHFSVEVSEDNENGARVIW